MKLFVTAMLAYALSRPGSYGHGVVLSLVLVSLLFAPGLCIALLAMSLTLINFGVDAVSNPRLREGARPKRKEATA